MTIDAGMARARFHAAIFASRRLRYRTRTDRAARCLQRTEAVGGNQMREPSDRDRGAGAGSRTTCTLPAQPAQRAAIAAPAGVIPAAYAKRRRSPAPST